MQSGKCIKCDSEQVFKSVNGIVSGEKMVYVRDIYQQWWNNYRDGDWQHKDPLDGTFYTWF